jgi:toxin ParE1/3/4
MMVVLTRDAETDLELIGDYIAKDNPTRAVSFIKELRECCLQIAQFPEAFPILERYKQVKIRRKIYGNYLIFYIETTKTINIIRILNGAKNYQGILFKLD